MRQTIMFQNSRNVIFPKVQYFQDPRFLEWIVLLQNVKNPYKPTLWVNELTLLYFGCLNLYFESLNLCFGCLNLIAVGA